MPRVPYSPVPTVEPTHVSPGKINPSVSANMFGAGVAEAKVGLGRALEGAGKELFDRAMAMQQLANEAEAKEADTKFIEAAGGLSAQFNALEGRNAVDAFPKYQEDLKKTREEIRKGLSNDAVRRVYDRDTLPTVGRTTFSWAGHSARENKQYALGASAARVRAAGDEAATTPNSDVEFQRAVNLVKQEISEQADLNGWAPEKAALETDLKVSELWQKRIMGMARSQPYAAKRLLDRALERGELRGEALGNTENFVRQKMYTVGARNISSAVSSGAGGMQGAGKVTLPQARQAIGTIESGNNYRAIGPQITNPNSRYFGDRAYGKYQVMGKNIPVWTKEVLGKAMTPQEFLADDKAQDTVFDVKFGEAMEKHGSFNDATSVWFTGLTQAEAVAKGRHDGYTRVQDYIARANGALAKNSSLADRVTLAQAEAKRQDPDDPLFLDYVQQRVTADFNADQAIKRNDDFNNRQTVAGAIIGDGKGKPPTNLDELFAANPAVEMVWAKLDNTVKAQYLRALASNSRGDVPWNDTRLRRWQELKGQAQADPAGFTSADLINEDLPLSARRELMNLQNKLTAKAETDPRVTRALQILAPTMEAAGVTRRNNQSVFYEFVGSLQDALQQWQEENKKAPTADDVKSIGARLLQEQSTGLFNRIPDASGWGKTQMFQLRPTQEDIERIEAMPQWAERGIKPSPDLIERVFRAEQYNRLYGGKPTKPQGPKVPISQ